MSDELREDRVLEVERLFRQAELFGTPAVLSKDGKHVGVMFSASYGFDDEGAEDEALAEAFDRGTAGQPFVAELQALAETEEGRAILLDAYRRWQEADDDQEVPT
jgi:hypothetical protein